MEDELRLRLDGLEKKIDAIYVSAEKTRKYFLWTIIATVALFLLPLLGLALVIPSFMSAYGQMGGLLQ